MALPLLGVGTADAAFIRRSTIKVITNTSNVSYRVVTTLGSGTPFSAVTAEAESDAGSEDVALVESDAWLHGAASINALPRTDAALTLTLYDTGSASLMSFSGVLGTDGAVTLTADATKDTGKGADCASKLGCDTSDTSDTALDIEVLAGEVFATSGGYDIAIDLAGADTYEVAYAQFTVTESDEVTTCDEVKVCTTTGSSTTSKAEVGWDEIGSVWEGDLTLDHEGLVEVKVRAYDSAGEKLESAKSKMGLPWANDGDGVNVLATDDDPLTTVALMRRHEFRAGITLRVVKNTLLSVVSSGWSADSALPLDARFELTDGETITIPVNSYQRTGRAKAWMVNNFEVHPVFGLRSTITITGGNLEIYDASVLDLLSPVCDGGTCVTLIEDERGDYDVSVSTYGSDAAKLADDVELTLTVNDGAGGEEYSGSSLIEFDDEITAIFANEVTFSEDPTGLDLAGKVSLLGAANKKGKQETLAKGKFYGSVSRDGDGDLGLAGADKDTVSPRGDVVVAGDPVAFELTTDTNKDGVLSPPPVTLVYAEGQPVRFYQIELEDILITN